MNHFERDETGALRCEGVALADIAARVGTPAYTYSAATLRRHFRVFDRAWGDAPHLVAYSVKALSNLAILRLLAAEGAGFDIVSGGELARVLRAGGRADRVVFSGVGKTRAEMEAALEAGIRSFNVESLAELRTLSDVARAHGTQAPVSLRVNPAVDPQTHAYIATGLASSKFGIPQDRARDAYREALGLPGLDVVGLDYHIGSQLSVLEPMVQALERMLELVDELGREGLTLRDLDVGGGLGIPYADERPPSPAVYAEKLLSVLAGRALHIITEPGRVIAGNAGVLLMRVIRTKDNLAKRFAVVDAAMNDAIRPALYGAWHTIEPVAPPRPGQQTVDVVGPVCESGDFFARDRPLPPLAAGDLLVLRTAGAYGFSMASNYNSRPRAPEVLVDGDRFSVVRARETVDDLLRGETIPAWLDG